MKALMLLQLDGWNPDFSGEISSDFSPEEMTSEVELPTISLTSEEISPSLSSPEENPAQVKVQMK